VLIVANRLFGGAIAAQNVDVRNKKLLPELKVYQKALISGKISKMASIVEKQILVLPT